MIKRTEKHYIMQYVLLPAVLVGSDILIGMLGHYSGSVGILNVFSIEHFIDYITNHYYEILIFLVIAILIALYVEYLIQKIGNDK